MSEPQLVHGGHSSCLLTSTSHALPPCNNNNCRAAGEQLLVVLCSLAGLLAEQDQPLLLELHAGTLDLLLGEHLSDACSAPLACS